MTDWPWLSPWPTLVPAHYHHAVLSAKPGWFCSFTSLIWYKSWAASYNFVSCISFGRIQIGALFFRGFRLFVKRVGNCLFLSNFFTVFHIPEANFTVISQKFWVVGYIDSIFWSGDLKVLDLSTVEPLYDVTFPVFSKVW